VRGTGRKREKDNFLGEKVALKKYLKIKRKFSCPVKLEENFKTRI